MTPRGTTRWWRDADPLAKRSLLAAGAGWMLDAMDVMLYAFALTAIRAEFHLTDAQAGALASATLLASALGGAVSGALADRFGRVRMLMASILIYSAFTGLTATAHSVEALVLWRVLVGLGMGAEWSAGAVLVAETWPAKHRGKAIGLMQSGWAVGYILAALLAAIVLPRWGWRPLFVVGIAPAFLLVWIRRGLREPSEWAARPKSERGGLRALGALARPPLAQRALIGTALAGCLLFAYWGLFTWMPAFLASPAERGGAGLGVVRSTTWIVAMQVGAFLGYTSFGFLADRIGRRPAFIAFVLGAAILVPVYGLSARSATTLLILAPLVGFFGHGYFSVFGAMLAELFPLSVRGAAVGACYNLGRAASALAPWTVGALAKDRGLGAALALTAALYIVGAALVMLLPETRAKEIQ